MDLLQYTLLYSGLKGCTAMTKHKKLIPRQEEGNSCRNARSAIVPYFTCCRQAFSQIATRSAPKQGFSFSTSTPVRDVFH